MAVPIDFNATGITVPDYIVYGLAFNTQDYGSNPVGVAGPYNSLGFALTNGSPFVGGNPAPDTAFWNTQNATYYTDGGAAGVWIFRLDTGWFPDSGVVEFDAAPEPRTVGLLGVGLLVVALGRLKRIG